MIDLNSPLAAQMLRRILDQQVERKLAELMPRRAYGTVESVNLTTRKAAVFLYGETTETPGFALGSVTPLVGDLVRVFMLGADRYIDDVTGRGLMGMGTAFPSSPASGDLFYRTDRNLFYFWWPAVSRWLTTNVYTHSFPHLENIAASTTWRAPSRATMDSAGVYIENFDYSVYVGFPNGSTSRYWAFQQKYTNAANVATQLGATQEYNTDGLADSTWFEGRTVVAAMLPSTAREIDVTVVKSSTPGNLYAAGGFTYRMAG